MQLFDYSIFDNTLESILILNTNQELVYCNLAFANLMQMPLRRVKIGRPMSEISPSNHLIISTCLQKTSIIQEVSMQANDEEVRVQVCVEPIEIKSEKCWLLFIHDVSLENRLQTKYRAELQQKEIFIQKLDRKLFEISFLLEVSSEMNRAGVGDEIFNITLNLIGKKFDLQKAAFFQVSEKGKRLISAYGANPHEEDWENLAIKNADKLVTISATGTKDIRGELLLLGSAKINDEDRSLLVNAASQLISRLEQELLYSNSITDEKTGLYNARFFQISLRKEIERTDRNGEGFGLLVVDIDHFKKFNDTYGHQTGDEVLIFVSHKIKESIRTADIPSRFGGEEFCVIAVDTNREGLFVVMERIRNSIADAIYPSKQHGDLRITVSIGGAMYPEDTNTAEDLFALADEALYESKRNGRNQSTIKKKAVAS